MQYRSMGIAMSMFVFFVLAFIYPATLHAEESKLSPEQKKQLEFFGLDPNVMKGEELLKMLDGGCSTNPFPTLESQYKSGRNVQITPNASGNGSFKTGIDPALACRLVKLFEAAKQQGCAVKIISAYRSAQQQQDMCGKGGTGCAPAGKSCHQYGLAVDVSGKCIGWMRKVAPKFGLVFPYYGDHIQCAEHPVASCSPATRPCNGSVKINPDLSTLPRTSDVPDSYFAPPPGRSPFQNPGSQFLPPPTQQCAPRYQCQGNTLMYIDASCNPQPSQQCPGGCYGETCIQTPPPQQQQQPPQQPPSGQTGSQPTGGTSPSGNTTGANNPGTQTLPSPNPVSDLLSSPLLSGYNSLPRIATSTAPTLPKATTTPFDLIQRYAGETATTTEGDDEDYYYEENVSDILNADLSDIAGMRPNIRPLEDVLSDAPPQMRPATGTIALQQPVGQTFITNDLKDSPVPAATTSYVSSNSTIGRILANMRTILEWALRFLRSFNQNPVAPLPTATFQPIQQFVE